MRAVTPGLTVGLRIIWFPAGRRYDDRVVYVPISEKWMLAIDRGVLHATPASLNRNSRRKTVDTACGRRARLFSIATETRALVTPWPAPAKWTEHTRCRECMTETGNKRPHRMYREIALTTEETDRG